MLYQAVTVSTYEAREEVAEWISKGTFLGKDGLPVILMYPGVLRLTCWLASWEGYVQSCST